MDSRRDLLAVVQNLNSIASPGKVLVVPLSSDAARTVHRSEGSKEASRSVTSTDSRSLSGDGNDELLLEEHVELSPAYSDASDGSDSSSGNYDNCSIEKLEFMASLSLLPKPLVKDLQEQNTVIKQHYGNWCERLHSKDFSSIQSEMYGIDYSHTTAELANFSGYDQLPCQQDSVIDSRRNVLLANAQQAQQPVAMGTISEQQHNSNLLQIAHELQERHKALAEAKHKLESEEEILKQNIHQLASCFNAQQN